MVSNMSLICSGHIFSSFLDPDANKVSLETDAIGCNKIKNGLANFGIRSMEMISVIISISIRKANLLKVTHGKYRFNQKIWRTGIAHQIY